MIASTFDQYDTHTRVEVEGRIDGSRVIFVVECPNDFEARAIKYLNHIKQTNRLTGDVKTSLVATIGKKERWNGES